MELLIDRFDILQKLGHGINGTVFLVRDKTDNNTKALKIKKGKFDTEKEELLKRVSMPPNCVSMVVCQYEFKEYLYNGSIVYTILMEYFPGETIDSIVENSTDIDPDVLFEYFKVALEGLIHFEKNHVIHNDIHTGNIMFFNGTLKIIDLDRAIDSDKGRDKLRIAFKEYKWPDVYRLGKAFLNIINYGKNRSETINLRKLRSAIAMATEKKQLSAKELYDTIISDDSRLLSHIFKTKHTVKI